VKPELSPVKYVVPDVNESVPDEPEKLFASVCTPVVENPNVPPARSYVPVNPDKSPVKYVVPASASIVPEPEMLVEKV
jgi:hypothetical protein